jgi:hypothetical protein
MSNESDEITPVPDSMSVPQEDERSPMRGAPAWVASRRFRRKATSSLSDFIHGDLEGVFVPHANIVDFRPSEVSGEHQEHQKTRELIGEKLADLAKKQDIIQAKEEIIGSLENQIRDLQRCLEERTAELAKTQELEACSARLCQEVRSQSEETRRCMGTELSDLRIYLSKFAPHKRFFRVTFGFLFFFSVAMFVNSVFGVRIIEPFWGATGIGVTAAMLVVIYFGMNDTEDSDSHAGKS